MLCMSLSYLLISSPFNKDGCHVYNNVDQNPGNLVASAACFNGLYRFDCKYIACKCKSMDSELTLSGSLPIQAHSLLLDDREDLLSATVTADLAVELWHRRLGHLSLQGMKNLQKVACGMNVLFQHGNEDLKNCVPLRARCRPHLILKRRRVLLNHCN